MTNTQRPNVTLDLEDLPYNTVLALEMFRRHHQYVDIVDAIDVLLCYALGLPENEYEQTTGPHALCALNNPVSNARYRCKMCDNQRQDI